ncbi:MAG TPA: hypothetical protein VLH86_04010 [Patescibacteria group bacterium]|nr:hypothetical protein [Patescibacteria group bacterium]
MADIHEVATGLDTAKEKFGKGNEATILAEDRRQLAAEALAKILSGIDELFAIKAVHVAGSVGTAIAGAHLEHREAVTAVSGVAHDSEHPAAQRALTSGRAACGSLLGDPVLDDSARGNANLLTVDSNIDALSIHLSNARHHAELALEGIAGLETDLQTAATEGATALAATEEYRASISAE